LYVIRHTHSFCPGIFISFVANGNRRVANSPTGRSSSMVATTTTIIKALPTAVSLFRCCFVIVVIMVVVFCGFHFFSHFHLFYLQF